MVLANKNDTIIASVIARKIPMANEILPIFVFVRFAIIGIWTIESSIPVIILTRKPVKIYCISIFLFIKIKFFFINRIMRRLIFNLF